MSYGCFFGNKTATWIEFDCYSYRCSDIKKQLAEKALSGKTNEQKKVNQYSKITIDIATVKRFKKSKKIIYNKFKTPQNSSK